MRCYCEDSEECATRRCLIRKCGADARGGALVPARYEGQSEAARARKRDDGARNASDLAFDGAGRNVADVEQAQQGNDQRQRAR